MRYFGKVGKTLMVKCLNYISRLAENLKLKCIFLTFLLSIALDTFFSIFSFSKSCKLFRKGFWFSFSRLLLASCCQFEALPLHPLLFILSLALNLTDHCQGYAFLARRPPILPHRQQLLGFNSEKGHPAAQTGHEMHFLPPTC